MLHKPDDMSRRLSRRSYDPKEYRPDRPSRDPPASHEHGDEEGTPPDEITGQELTDGASETGRRPAQASLPPDDVPPAGGDVDDHTRHHPPHPPWAKQRWARGA